MPLTSLFSERLMIAAFTTCLQNADIKRGNRRCLRWPIMKSDQVSTDGRARIGAAVGMYDPMMKSNYKGKGDQIPTGDPAWTDG